MAWARNTTVLRGFVLVGFGYFLAWQAAVVFEAPHRATMALAIHGFVFHVIFGKGYALIPSYFDRELAFDLGPMIHLPLTVLGTVGLTLGPVAGASELESLGAVAWGAGGAIFLITILATVRDNVVGRETGTGEANRHRRAVDQLANAFVPVALFYLAVGSYETVALHTALPGVIGSHAGLSHVLAAGTAGLLVLTIGARLLPRFMVAEPPLLFVLFMLPAGALGPWVIATHLRGGLLFRIGATLQAVAIVSYAIVVLVLFRRSDRRRVGLYGVALGAIAGIVAVLLGLAMAFEYEPIVLSVIHHRFTLLGFLGLTIIGVSFQFYPPGIGTLPAVGDRTAAIGLGSLATGLLLELVGTIGSLEPLVLAGSGLTFGAAAAICYVLFGVVLERGL